MTTFADLDLDGRVIEALRRMGVIEPTPIQEATIQELIAGHDVVGQARTGSGKTLAFAVPLLEICDPGLASAQALILVPTRELAGQVGRVIDQLTPVRQLRAAQIYGGRDMSDQLALLNTGPQIIIGTPGRVLDHLYRGSLSLRDLRYLVLDEADQMLDAGFSEDVERILDCAPEGPQMALFSATVPGWVHEVISHRLHEPKIIKVDEHQSGPNSSVEHLVIEVPVNRKIEALCELLEQRGNGTVLVFARTKIGVEKLARQLEHMGYPVSALQGNLGQSQRERVLRGFRRGRPPILVATNVAARGLDILSIEQVINFEVPESAEMLTHRLGRTGRMGREGNAVTLLSPPELRKWKEIERELPARIKRVRWGMPPVATGEAQAASQPASSEPNTDTRSSPRPVRQEQGGNRPDGERRPQQRRRQPRVRHQVVCADCQRETTVSFVPTADRPVYCNACFRQRKETSAA